MAFVNNQSRYVIDTMPRDRYCIKFYRGTDYQIICYWADSITEAVAWLRLAKQEGRIAKDSRFYIRDSGETDEIDESGQVRE